MFRPKVNDIAGAERSDALNEQHFLGSGKMCQHRGTRLAEPRAPEAERDMRR